MNDTRKNPDGHTFLLAFEATDVDRELAESSVVSFARGWLEGSPLAECWWVAEDDRHDGSDNDSAVFVPKGEQAAWAVKVARAREWPPCVTCLQDVMDTEMCPNAKSECTHCCGCDDHDSPRWEHRAIRVLELYSLHDQGVEDGATLVKDLLTDLVHTIRLGNLDEQDLWDSAVVAADAEDEEEPNSGLYRRINAKAERENHEWRWATWTPAPTEPGGAPTDQIDIRDKGMTVWTIITVEDYLKGES